MLPLPSGIVFGSMKPSADCRPPHARLAAAGLAAVVDSGAKELGGIQLCSAHGATDLVGQQLDARVGLSAREADAPIHGCSSAQGVRVAGVTNGSERADVATR